MVVALEAASIKEIGRALRSREVSVVEIVNYFLDIIKQKDDLVKAWVTVDVDGAKLQAEALQKEISTGYDRGPLHGIPVGIKDIIDVEGLPTTCGASWRQNWIAKDDADCVKALRENGAVILGKTVTTQFACYDPSETQNPKFSGFSPGGSSSGSAASVAARMCVSKESSLNSFNWNLTRKSLGSSPRMPFTGTQTGGSIIRPASYCGITGLKPAYGYISTKGVFPFAPSLDHVGLFARDVQDLEIVFNSLNRQAQRLEHPKIDPNLICLKDFSLENINDEIQTTIETLCDQLDETKLPINFNRVVEHHKLITCYEGSRIHAESFSQNKEGYAPKISSLIEQGFSVDKSTYEGAMDTMSRYRSRIYSLIDPNTVLIMAATNSFPPPIEARSTGNPILNIPWSFFGLPSLSFPINQSKSGFPICVQLVSPDVELLFKGAELLLERRNK